MPRKAKRNKQIDRILAIDECLAENLPQLYAWLNDDDDFTELRIYKRGHADFMGILKGISGDSTPMICFGTGYGTMGVLLGLEGALANNRWRVDKPWNGGGESEET